MTLPQEFKTRIASHNRHAIIAAVLCLIGAWIGWIFMYWLFVGLSLGVLTVLHGSEVITGNHLLSIPHWLYLMTFAGAGFLLVWAAIDQRIYWNKPPSDRRILGWHIISDLMLIPARLTFGVWKHLSAIVYLSRTHQYEAFEILRHIFDKKKCSLNFLGAHFHDRDRLRSLIATLQLLGWIDLHRHMDDWIYTIPSNELENVAMMMRTDLEKE